MREGWSQDSVHAGSVLVVSAAGSSRRRLAKLADRSQGHHPGLFSLPELSVMVVFFVGQTSTLFGASCSARLALCAPQEYSEFVNPGLSC